MKTFIEKKHWYFNRLFLQPRLKTIESDILLIWLLYDKEASTTLLFTCAFLGSADSSLGIIRSPSESLQGHRLESGLQPILHRANAFYFRYQNRLSYYYAQNPAQSLAFGLYYEKDRGFDQTIDWRTPYTDYSMNKTNAQHHGIMPLYYQIGPITTKLANL